MRIPEKKPATKTSIKLIFVISLAMIIVFLWHKTFSKNGNGSVLLDDVIIATVKQGDLIREVRAPGVLVPNSPSYLSATSNGRVNKILLEASDEVNIGSLIMILDNPELIQSVDEAKFEVEALETSYQSLEHKWQQTILKQRIVVADFNGRYEMIRLRREANHKLLSTGAVSDIDYNESMLLEKQLKFQHTLEVQLLDMLPALQSAELSAVKTQIDKAKRHLSLKEKLADDLYVKATSKGIVQEVSLQVGEPFKVGTVLARIAQQNDLKAELHVQEGLVKEVSKGQTVALSAGGKVAQGIVKRIDPTVQQGVVKVDVSFTDEILIGARPDLRINGVIELEHLKNVLTLKRPVFSKEFSSGTLFVLHENEMAAVQKDIKFGRSSLYDIEVISSLKAGDRVIVSSTNKYDVYNEINLVK